MCACVGTCYKTHSPQARVQCHLDVDRLVLLQYDALLHQQPIIRRHGNPYQQQSACPKHRGEQRQSPTAARAHLHTNAHIQNNIRAGGRTLSFFSLYKQR